MGHPGELLDPPPTCRSVRAQAPGARRATRCGQQVPLLQVQVQVPCPGGQWAQWARPLRDGCTYIQSVSWGLPTELCIYTLYHGLVHWERYVNNVTWACPLRDENSLVYIYKVFYGLAHFLTHREISCSYIALTVAASSLNQVVHVFGEIWVRNAFTLFIKHLFCFQYLIELYLEFIGFLGLLLFSPIYSWLFKCICKGCEEFFLLGIICIYSAVVIVAQVTHSYLILEKYSLSLYMYYIVYYFQYICTTKMHGLPFYYPYVLYQLAIKHFVCDFSDKKLQSTYFILQWMLCILRMLSSKKLSNVNTQVFLMGAHVKFHQGLLFFLHDCVYFVVENSSYLDLLHLLPLWILHIFFA